MLCACAVGRRTLHRPDLHHNHRLSLHPNRRPWRSRRALLCVPASRPSSVNGDEDPCQRKRKLVSCHPCDGKDTLAVSERLLGAVSGRCIRRRFSAGLQRCDGPSGERLPIPGCSGVARYRSPPTHTSNSFATTIDVTPLLIAVHRGVQKDFLVYRQTTSTPHAAVRVGAASTAKRERPFRSPAQRVRACRWRVHPPETVVVSVALVSSTRSRTLQAVSPAVQASSTRRSGRLRARIARQAVRRPLDRCYDLILLAKYNARKTSLSALTDSSAIRVGRLLSDRRCSHTNGLGSLRGRHIQQRPRCNEQHDMHAMSGGEEEPAAWGKQQQDVPRLFTRLVCIGRGKHRLLVLSRGHLSGRRWHDGVRSLWSRNVRFRGWQRTLQQLPCPTEQRARHGVM